MVTIGNARRVDLDHADGGDGGGSALKILMTLTMLYCIFGIRHQILQSKTTYLSPELPGQIRDDRHDGDGRGVVAGPSSDTIDVSVRVMDQEVVPLHDVRHHRNAAGAARRVDVGPAAARQNGVGAQRGAAGSRSS